MPLGASRLNTLSRVLTTPFSGLAGIQLDADSTQGVSSAASDVYKRQV